MATELSLVDEAAAWLSSKANVERSAFRRNTIVAVVFDVVPGDVDDSTFCTSTGNGMLLPLRRGTRMCPYGT